MGTFAVPDTANRPATYWFWHTVPTRHEIETQVAQIRAGGFGSFQVQARLAFPRTEFLGEAHLEAVATAVEEAARLGLRVGIYDDYNWQSGHAGGRTVAGHDHLREEHVFWSVAVGDPGEALTLVVDDIDSSTPGLGPAAMQWLYEDGVCHWADWTVVAVLAEPVTDGRGAPARDLTGASAARHADERSCTVEVSLPGDLTGPHRVTAFVRARSTTSRLPNYLLTESAERFVEVAYEPYARVLGDHLGSTVEYVFFDQPHATYWTWAQHEGNLRSSLPWSPELPARFEATHGLDAHRALLALVHDVGEETARLRTTWYETSSRLVQESFLGVLADWCHDHGLALSGHEVLGHVGSWSPTRSFDAWDLRTNIGVDHFGVDAFRDRTGVDAQDCVPQLSAKLGDSVARANGRSGCIVEQYLLGDPGSYPGDWNLTLADVRAQALRLHLAGARQFLFHAFWQSDGTAANTDALSNPRFDFAPGINFEPWWGFHAAFADESARLSTFLDACEPVCEVAVLWPLRTMWAEGSAHDQGDHVAFWAEHLAREGIGHHVVDERDLLAATVSDGSLHVGTRAYRALVLPSVTTLRSAATVDALRRFAEAGGVLVVSGDSPRSAQEGPPGAVAAAWAEVVPVRHVETASASVRDVLEPLRSDRPWLRVDGPGVWQWAGTPRCRGDDEWRIAAFNDTTEERVATLVTPWPAAEGCRWSAADGRVGDWDTLVTLRLGPMELVCLGVRSDDGTAPRPTPPETPLPVAEVELAGGWVLDLPAAGGSGPMPVDPGRGWEQQGFAAYSGLGVYRRRLEVPGDPRLRWSLVLPAVHTAAEVRLDGHPLGRRGWPPYVFALPDLAPGPHELEVRVHSTAGNAYLHGTPFEHPVPSGLSATPVLRGIMAPTTTAPDRHPDPRGR